MIRTARDILQEKSGHMVTVSTEATVYQAVKIMSQNRIGAIVVVDEGRIVGIWKFLGRRIRHLLIKEHDEYVGILSVGDVMRANLQQRAEEYKDLNEMVSLEYYENWKVQHDGALR